MVEVPVILKDHSVKESPLSRGRYAQQFYKLKSNFHLNLILDLLFPLKIKQSFILIVAFVVGELNISGW